MSISGHAVLSGNRVSAMFQLLRSVHFLSSAISATEPQMVQCEASSVLCPELRSSCLARLKEQTTASLNHFIRVGCGHLLNHVEPLYAWMIRLDATVLCVCLASICLHSLHMRRHHVHPLVEEANVITREVPDDKLGLRQLRLECHDP